MNILDLFQMPVCEITLHFFFIFISLPMETFWTIIYTSEKYNCSKLIKLIADEIR